jgi:hypothetical protein
MTTRRNFLKASGTMAAMPWFFNSSAANAAKAAPQSAAANWTPLPQAAEDKFSVAQGFQWNVIAKTGDRISKTGARFGDCADFTTFLPGTGKNHGHLWVNHEAVTVSVLYDRWVDGKDKTKAMVDEEMKLVGGSYLEISRDPATRAWSLFADSGTAFRIDGHTDIPLVGPAGGKTARGTCQNCSGGQTPWGTVLSCEENFDESWDGRDDAAGWKRHYDEPLENYGWVVEIDPKTKKARKLTALGRFAHEGAWVHVAADKRVVVYMGDDAKFERLYKFVSHGKVSGDQAKDMDLLAEGSLYVANFAANRWELLSLANPKIKAAGSFNSEADVLVRTREAAAAAGGTPLARPEGIVMDPRDGRIYVSLTNNDKAGDYYGNILVLSEAEGNHTGTGFDFDVFYAGSVASGMVCPDNMAIGPNGTLWVTNDISGSKLGKGMYRRFQRNGIYLLERDRAGVVRANCFALAPYDAELTGPWFHPDKEDLFLCIQHPGEMSYSGGRALTSNWPAGGNAKPASAVVAIRGEQSTFV